MSAAPTASPKRIDAGMVWVNSENVRHLPTPFGGMKASGIGRDGGDYSFDFYMETKNICVALDAHTMPRIGAYARSSRADSSTEFYPPFNVVRIAYVRTAMSTDLALVEGVLGRCAGVRRDRGDQRRAVPARPRRAEPPLGRSAQSAAARRDAPSASRCSARRTSIGRAGFVRARGLAASVRRAAGTGTHAAFSDPARHTDRAVLQDAIGAFDAPPVRRLSWRPHPAHRSRQLLFAGRAGIVRLLHRDRVPHDRVRGRRRQRSTLVGMAASQRRRSRHRVHQRARTAFPSRRHVGELGHRHHPHVRRAVDDRLAGEHGARPGPARAFQCVLPVSPRSGRASRRAVHQRLSDRRSGFRADAVGLCAIRSDRRSGACRRRAAGSKRARSFPVNPSASRYWMRSPSSRPGSRCFFSSARCSPPI